MYHTISNYFRRIRDKYENEMKELERSEKSYQERYSQAKVGYRLFYTVSFMYELSDSFLKNCNLKNPSYLISNLQS